MSLPAGATFVAAATDGVDGLSDTGGAIVDGAFLRRAGKAKIERALEQFDTGTLHRAMKTALERSPSGRNLADLHLLIVS
jgi:glycerate-2-kinase